MFVLFMLRVGGNYLFTMGAPLGALNFTNAAIPGAR